jgi:hypothetical protein
MSRVKSLWRQISEDRWEREDGAVVHNDRTTQWSTSEPWRPKHRSWIAFGPGQNQSNFLGYFPRRPRALTRSPNRVPVKFRSAENAMRALDRAADAGKSGGRASLGELPLGV